MANRRSGAFAPVLRSMCRGNALSVTHLPLQFQRRSISSSGSSPDDKPDSGISYWSSFGYPYMFKRCMGIASRVCGDWSRFIDYYEHGVFARRSSDESRSRMFVLTCMPRATTLDLFEFMTGATHAVKMVYGELYAERMRYPDVCVDHLQHIVANETTLSVLTRKPLRQTQQLALQSEPRRTRLVLEKLDIREVGLVSVDYQMHALSEDQAAQRGYLEEEWLRMEVAYEVVEHVRVTTADSARHTDAIDDHKTFETAFSWTFESPVSDPHHIDWKIVSASDFVDKPAIVRATPRRPVG